MREILLRRLLSNDRYTIGYLSTGSNNYFTLELPDRENRVNRSCIPTGEYRCSHMVRSSSGKYRNVFHVEGVQGRSGILIHNGNLPSHTKGCILLGTRLGELMGQRAVLNSRVAMKEFNRDMGQDPFNLKVESWAL